MHRAGAGARRARQHTADRAAASRPADAVANPLSRAGAGAPPASMASYSSASTKDLLRFSHHLPLRQREPAQREELAV
eukprot:COSAG04_NODE_8485_length_967_cov_7.180876_1_plen_77_part_10